MTYFKETRQFFSVSMTLAATIVLVGCSASRPPKPNGESASSNTKVIADAYLFDTRITRGGKLVSMRLEIFDADSVIALSGRAYLGKGALRGRITRDSVLLYFPGSNEYVSETTDELMHSDTCRLKMAKLDLIGLLSHSPTPAASATPGEFILTASSTEEQDLVASWCRKIFELKYYRTGEGWRLGQFEFNDSLGTEIQAKRREIRFGAKIKNSQFQVTIPPDAERIKP